MPCHAMPRQQIRPTRTRERKGKKKRVSNGQCGITRSTMKRNRTHNSDERKQRTTYTILQLSLVPGKAKGSLWGVLGTFAWERRGVSVLVLRIISIDLIYIALLTMSISTPPFPSVYSRPSAAPIAPPPPLIWMVSISEWSLCVYHPARVLSGFVLVGKIPLPGLSRLLQ